MKMQTFVSFKGHPSLEKLGTRLTLLIPRRTTYPCILYHIGDARGDVIVIAAGMINLFLDKNYSMLSLTHTPCLELELKSLGSEKRSVFGHIYQIGYRSVSGLYFLWTLLFYNHLAIGRLSTKLRNIILSLRSLFLSRSRVFLVVKNCWAKQCKKKKIYSSLKVNWIWPKVVLLFRSTYLSRTRL